MNTQDKEIIFRKLGGYKQTTAGTWIYPEGTEFSALPMYFDYESALEEIIINTGLNRDELIEIALLKLAQEVK